MPGDPPAKARHNPRGRGGPRTKDGAGSPTGSADQRGPRRRRARGGRRDTPAELKPLTDNATLDLNRDRDTALSEQERDEAMLHLEFLRRFKPALRLSVNAKEDLLVNGTRPPDDRGVLKHLFSKIDKATVDRALSRDPLKSDTKQRTEFLAGVVRLNPDPGALLNYLETLVEASHRRLAARAFGATIRRMDFSSMSGAQLNRLLEVCRATFSGPDRVQAFFGLLDSESFQQTLQQHSADLVPKIADELLPLAAALRAVSGNAGLPKDESTRALVTTGIARWMAAPAEVLVSYSLEQRIRLAEFVVVAADGTAPGALPPALMDSIPRDHERYLQLGLNWSEKLLQAGQADAALGLLRQVCQAHPDHRDAARRCKALQGEKFGPLVLNEKVQGDFQSAFWPREAAHGWAWLGTAEQAKDVAARARWQAEISMPGVAPLLAHGRGPGARPFMLLAAGGQPLSPKRLGLRDALRLTRDALLILRGLASLGIELPDAHPTRFWSQGREGLKLMDLDGATRSDETRAMMALAEPAKTLVYALLRDHEQDELRSDLPEDVAKVMKGRAPLTLLTKALVLACARL